MVNVSPSASRGEVTLQPSYFTSSLFVHPLREDIHTLVLLFVEQLGQAQSSQPFALFKSIWLAQGWPYLHFKVFDARARDVFLHVVVRLFLERCAETEQTVHRVAGLFGLYTFFATQPLTFIPPLYSLNHIPIPIDLYTSLLSLPKVLTAHNLTSLKPHVSVVLSRLLKTSLPNSSQSVFHILPSSTLNPLNPQTLPRELFVQDSFDSTAPNYEHLFPRTITPTTSLAAASSSGQTVKKKGRPSKHEKAKKAKEAVAALDKWLDKTTIAPPPAIGDQSQLQLSAGFAMNGSLGGRSSPTPVSNAHSLLVQRPIPTLATYRDSKSALLSALPSPPSGTTGQNIGPLRRANEAVLQRLRRIDAAAAERGLEVGGEDGDERTGLGRVEKAVKELNTSSLLDEGLGRKGRGGILGLVDGAGLDDSAEEGK